MKTLSICSGVGGLDLGLERAGFDVVGMVERDPYAARVLARHWPGVPILDDVAKVGDEWRGVDAIVGGFPCQPHSHAGKQRASADERDLWPQMRRILGVVGPAIGIFENVRGLLTSEDGAFFRGILRDADALGMSAEWDHLPACAVGAPHIRDRVFLILRADGGVTWPGDEAEVGGVLSLFGATRATWPRGGRYAGGRCYARAPRWPVAANDPRRAAFDPDADRIPGGGGRDPTPTARDAAGSRNATVPRQPGSAHHDGVTLTDFVTLWPTPTAGDFSGGEDVAAFLAWRETLRAKHTNGNGCGIPLGVAVRMFPTPSATMADRGDRGDRGDLVNLLRGNAAAKHAGGRIVRDAGLACPTPRASDHRSGCQGELVEGYTNARPLNEVAWAREGKPMSGKLNPTWEEWLVGLPIGWTLPDGESLRSAPSLPFDPEPDIPRLTQERQHRTDRVRCIGNIVVPQVAEVIGRAVRGG